MSGEIFVNHQEVYSLVETLRGYIATEIVGEAERCYAAINSEIGQVDSGAQAALVEGMQSNRDKTMMCAMTLDKLLAFIESAARELEAEDKAMAVNIDQ